MTALSRGFLFLTVIPFFTLSCLWLEPTSTSTSEALKLVPTATSTLQSTKIPATIPIKPIISTPTATLSPTSMSLPTEKSGWKCYQGGITCYAGLRFVTMLNSSEGWAVGWGAQIGRGQGKVAERLILHYSKQPNETQPTWKVVTPSPSPPLASVFTTPNVGRAVSDDNTELYSKHGVWRELPIDEITDAIMVSPDEGWAVGDEGLILHYFDDEWRPVPSPTKNRLFAIEMLNTNEGWAVGYNATILAYHDQHWEQMPVTTKYTIDPTLYDIQMLSQDEGWAVGETILP